jgi:hypothetical protein
VEWSGLEDWGWSQIHSAQASPPEFKINIAYIHETFSFRSAEFIFYSYYKNLRATAGPMGYL